MEPAPSAEIAFFTPQLSKFLTSFLPSTTISDDDDSIFGPQVRPWNCFAVPTVSTDLTSSITVFDAASPELTSSSSSSLARSTTLVRLVALISWISFTVIFAVHGPILSMVSNEEAIIAVSTLSRLLGIMIIPCTLPPLFSISTSTCPILAVRWSFLNSNSSPSRPSVWPIIAPMMSFLCTVPLTFMSARTIYFIALLLFEGLPPLLFPFLDI